MQCYREYSSTEYYNSSTGSNGGYDMASDWATGGGQYGQNMMMPGRKKQAQQYHCNQSQAHSSYGMADDYAMNKVGHYGEYGQGYNSGGNVVPYAAGHDHMSNAQYNQKYMSKANARYGGGYGSGQGVMTGNGGGFGGGGGGAHYLAKQQHQYASGEMGYLNGMNQKKMHRQRKSEKNMFHQMKTMSVSSSSSTSSRGNYSTRSINHSDDEYYSRSDGNDSGTDGECYDSDSDNDRRRSRRPIY
ncbi:keratin, type I cytoskeletal 9 [Morus notabilis]|uniref:keratin, type I cytoskeletal 9 n=1 Tax=Morus notabilis TaxID=981085 RepID=UPI000CED6A6A|nr:keratin, type I cytoskeletal 9 [Morus notabilis]